MRGRLYHLITKNENQELQSVLDADKSAALVRSADGRRAVCHACRRQVLLSRVVNTIINR